MIELDERQERLFRVIGGVGGDLIDAAEKRQFAVSLWRKWLPIAACMALLVGMTAWVLPQFRVKEEAPAQMETAEETAPVTQTGEEFVPENQEEMAAEEYLFVWSEEATAPKERLIINGTIYYPEAVYDPIHAELGEWVGSVEGAGVYAAGENWKETKQGIEMPLEIFVAQEDGYRYCLTYYAWDGPAYTLEEARALEDLTVFTIGTAFATPARDLTVENLVKFFLESLELERQAGRRTVDLDNYLWYDEQKEAYVIPVEDVAAQLDRYLDSWQWPELEEHEAIVLEDLDPPYRQAEEIQASVFGPETLTLLTDRYCYTIRFTEDRCLYDIIE